MKQTQEVSKQVEKKNRREGRVGCWPYPAEYTAYRKRTRIMSSLKRQMEDDMSDEYPDEIQTVEDVYKKICEL